MYYGLQLRAVGVLNLAGATDLTPAFVEGLGTISPNYPNLRQVVPDYATSLRNSYAAPGAPQLLIAYSAGHPRDRGQAERMGGMPNVELVPVEHAQHNVVDPLVRNRELMSLLHRLLSAEPALV